MNRFKAHNKNFYQLILLLIVILLSSCQATSFLKKDETFLRKNKIKFETHEKINDKIFLIEELSTLFKQEPNESIGWVPRQWFYYVNKGKTGRFSRFVNKNLAELPVIYSEELAKNTAEKFELFLKNNRGFYNAKVKYKPYKEKYVTDVDYIIQPGKRYIINKIKYDCDDKEIVNIVNNSANKSYLSPGKPISSLDYNEEKVRITNLLQNNGYALFNQNFIELYGDSSDYKVDLTIKINNASKNEYHKVYSVGKVEVFTDYHLTQNIDKLEKQKVNDITFYKELDNYIVNPQILEAAISLKPGQLCKKEINRKVYNKLTQFNIYRFITIKTEIDSIKSNTLNYKIYLFVHDNKYYHEEDFALKYVTLSTNTKFIELGVNGLIYNRNLTSRGDNISFSGTSDMKINIKDKDYSELNIIGKIDYTNPISPSTMKISPLFLYHRLIKNKSYNDLKNNATTNSSISYQYQTLIKILNVSSFNFSYGYKYTPSKRLNILSNQIGINYYIPEILDKSLFSKFQIKSRQKVFISGLFMKNIAVSYSSLPQQKLYSYKLFFGLEMSGMELFLANKLTNAISNNDKIWKFSNNVSFAKYLKTNIDFRPTYKTGPNSSFAGRIYTGIGYPYGDSDVLPYIKQLEVGGPNSMRAWAARELGPGSYKHQGKENEFPYQKGDIRLEANLEYRFKVSHYIKSALFIDAGNIWTLKYDNERIGSQFGNDFYKQIAVDAGISFQLDFIVLFRLDFAYKLRNPYLNDSNKYWEINLTQPSIVFAIDHPF